MIEFLNLLGRMFASGFTWAAIFAALNALENFYYKRQQRRLLYLIAKKVGVEWDTPHEELRKMVQQSYKQLSSLSRKEYILRRIAMEKLKSRKFWLTVAAALVPVINEEFGLHLDVATMGFMMTALMAGVGFIAHVDAKKILAGIMHVKVTPQKAAFVFATFQEALPQLKEIHNTINDLLADVKKDNTSEAFKEAMSTYAQIKLLLDSVKHPEPVTEVVEEQVAS